MGFPSGLLLALYNRLQATAQPFSFPESSSDIGGSSGSDGNEWWEEAFTRAAADRPCMLLDDDDDGDAQSITSISATTVAALFPGLLQQPQEHQQRQRQWPRKRVVSPSTHRKRVVGGNKEENEEIPSATSAPFPLLSLPLDLIHHLATTSLPPSAQVALKLSCRSLYSSLSHPSRALKSISPDDDCARAAIRHYLEQEGSIGSDAARSRSKGVGVIKAGGVRGRTRCALCKALYPASLFDRAGFVALDVGCEDAYRSGQIGERDETSGGGSNKDGKNAMAVVQRKKAEMRQPIGAVNLRNRVCKWHDGRFSRSLKRGKRGGGNDNARVVEGWKLEEACMHCGAVLGWESCDCNCQTCWKREVWCYTQVLEEEEDRVKEDVYLRWIF